MQRKTYKNKAEESFCTMIEALGGSMKLTKKGHADFILEDDDGNIMMVEVKPTKREKLRPEQDSLLRSLARYGVPCYKWDSESGELLPIEGIAHHFNPKTPLDR